MQVIAVCAMEPPARRDARALKDAMFGVFSAMPKADPKQYVRGQYEGYRKIKGVAKDSKTATFVAVRFEVDNWRWTGVPFFIRTGKELPVERWELRLIFKEPPRLGYSADSRRRPEPDQLVVRLHPTTGIRLLVDAQRSDETRPEQINLEMEFAQEGGEGPTPYEVLLHAAMVGNSTRFKRQDSIEETWRVCDPLLRSPRGSSRTNRGPGAQRPLTSSSRTTAAGTSRGPGHESREAEERRKTRSSGKAARAGDGKAPTAAKKEGMPQSAAMPSPFPPIADYAFISNCHTGALVAPDGAIDWLCVPRFDSPSIFGTLLDREAGSFRFGPFGINVPSNRIYEPGTNILNTTWHTPTGWAVVREALTIGPTLHEDEVTPHTRAPADEDAHHMLVRTVLCMEGSVDMELVCEPDFDYGRTPAEWSLQDRHTADASGAGVTVRLQSSIPLGAEGSGAGTAHAPEGRAGVLLAVLGGGARLAGGHGPGERTHERDRELLAHMGLQGPYA